MKESLDKGGVLKVGAEKDMGGAGENLIFILGIMQRSGTNYLNNLLLLHPDCDYPGMVWEDYLIAHAEQLDRYINLVYGSWNDLWKKDVDRRMGQKALIRAIGEGINSFINRQYEISLKTGRRSNNIGRKKDQVSRNLVTATPSIQNLRYCFQLFPCARLLVIVRDGRAVVESGMKSFNWDFENAARRWANAARSILEFKQSEKEGPYLIIRYEDLVTNEKEEMTRILSFLSLDGQIYDFDAAINLTVMGSSELSSQEGKVHWKAVKKNMDFNPLDRWKNWKRLQHERFNWVAGSCLEGFDYDQVLYDDSWNALWKLWNLALDRLYDLELWLEKREVGLYKLVSTARALLYAMPGRIRPECRESSQ